MDDLKKRILTVTDLQKSYITKGNTYPVLHGINMAVNQGEFIAVMGPSGSGKTTLLNIVSGFLSADSGSVMIGAENMLHTDKNKQAEIRSSVLGFIFQDFMLIDGLTVQENIYLPQIIAQKENAEMEQKTQKFLDTFGISEIADNSSIPLQQKTNVNHTVIIEDNRAYPFTLNASFRKPCVFRYEVDRKNSVENYYANGDVVTMTANNKVRVWISNGNTVKFQIIASSQTYELEIGKAGECIVEDIKWIRSEDGRYKLVVEPID